MYVTMQGEQRLSLFDETPDRNTTDMHIEGDVPVRLSVKSSTIQHRIV